MLLGPEELSTLQALFLAVTLTGPTVKNQLRSIVATWYPLISVELKPTETSSLKLGGANDKRMEQGCSDCAVAAPSDYWV